RRHPDAAAIVARRARLLAALRGCLDAQAFVEADPPALLPHAGQEAHLRPPPVELPGLPGALWLQTSPEMSLKRLVCAGVERVYALGPAYRGGRDELSRHHQPQFTMLEWYRPGTELEALVKDVRALGAVAAVALGVSAPRDGTLMSMGRAFTEYAGVSLDPLLDGDVPRFAAAARAAGVATCRDDDDLPTAFGRVLIERVEPALASLDGWVFLHGYPAFAASLAKLDPRDERVALRMEAYLGGVEIANGNVELEDADEHRRRWTAERAERDDAAPDMDAGLLAALEDPGLPPTVGMALGVDRLAMALLGAESLADILPFVLEPDPEA
ncbi:MAG: amino acid--tRNA ligase-related protein, partial [Planctomycetota bacterium]